MRLFCQEQEIILLSFLDEDKFLTDQVAAIDQYFLTGYFFFIDIQAVSLNGPSEFTFGRKHGGPFSEKVQHIDPGLQFGSRNPVLRNTFKDRQKSLFVQFPQAFSGTASKRFREASTAIS